MTVSVVALSKEMLALGTHLIEIEERDIFTEKVAVRQYALTVSEPTIANATNTTSSSSNYTFIPDFTTAQDDRKQDQVIDNDAGSGASDNVKGNASSGILVLPNGRIIYPWQMTKYLIQSEKDLTGDRKEKIEPLSAKIYDISPTGNLTIEFNKPILIPPLRVTEQSVASNGTRILAEIGISKYNIKEVVDI